MARLGLNADGPFRCWGLPSRPIDASRAQPYPEHVNAERSPKGTLTAYRWPLALVGIVLIVVFGLLSGLRSLKPPPLNTLDVSHAFTSSIPEVSREQGGVLEVATATVPEVFTRSDERYTAWGWLYLGENVSEIRSSVTYRYHVKLSEEWDVRISGQICRVIAPKLEPSLPSALHTDTMEKRTERGWARFDSGKQLEELEREITPTVNRYASDPLHIALVRPEARKTVAEFVQTWLLNQHGWKDDDFHIVEVKFRDEVEPTLMRAMPREEP